MNLYSNYSNPNPPTQNCIYPQLSPKRRLLVQGRCVAFLPPRIPQSSRADRLDAPRGGSISTRTLLT